jgi:hypothetical protein
VGSSMGSPQHLLSPSPSAPAVPAHSSRHVSSSQSLSSQPQLKAAYILAPAAPATLQSSHQQQLTAQPQLPAPAYSSQLTLTLSPSSSPAHTDQRSSKDTHPITVSPRSKLPSSPGSHYSKKHGHAYVSKGESRHIMFLSLRHGGK